MIEMSQPGQVTLTEREELRGEMAHIGVQVDRDFFSCSVCLNLLEEPVTIPCGHSYCLKCIRSAWDAEAWKNTSTCPQCRVTFTSEPVLVQNTMLAELLVEVKKSGHVAPDCCYAGPGDVVCDFCPGRKLKAFKSCLTCLASYCEQHLHPHFEVATFKKHRLVDPTEKLQENMCSRHDEAMKMFCRTDQQCVCFLCSVDEHRGHDTVSAATERAGRHKELDERLETILKRIQDKDRDEKILQQEVETINRAADKTLEESEKTFSELIRLLQKRSADVRQQIRSGQQTEVDRIRKLQKQLQQEIQELKARRAKLQQLSRTDDHIQFLLSYLSLSDLGESWTESTSITFSSLDFEEITSSVSKVRDQIQGVFIENIFNTVADVTHLQSNSQPMPKTRNEFLKYLCAITLDLKTVNPYMVVSEKNRRVTVVGKPQPYLHQPHRFIDCCQALSRESLKGRCYWELEWTGEGVCVGVTYKAISRAGLGNDCKFGENDKSWALHCFHKCFWHNNRQTVLSRSPGSKVGVYLDHTAGTLCFYSVADTMVLLHRVQTTFTHPLFVGLRLHHTFVDRVEFCEPQ